MNYSIFIVKIIEQPIQSCFEDDISVTEMFVKFPSIREKKSAETFRIFVWGNLATDVIKYYQVNDYIIIEGYISIQKNIPSSKNNDIQVSVRKIYPFM